MTVIEQNLVITLILIIVYLILGAIYNYYLSYAKTKSLKFLYSGLPNYFSALKFFDCEEFIEDEEHFRRFGFKLLENESLEKVKQVA